MAPSHQDAAKKSATAPAKRPTVDTPQPESADTTSLTPSIMGPVIPQPSGPRPTPTHVMQLQRQIGNRASAQLLGNRTAQRSHHAPPVQADDKDGGEVALETSAQDAVSPLVSPVTASTPALQRDPGDEDPAQLASVAAQVVGALPAPPENIPSESEVAQREDAGRQIGGEIGAMVQGKPNLAEAIVPIIVGDGGGGGDEPAPAEQAPVSPMNGPQPNSNAGAAPVSGSNVPTPNARARGSLDSTSTGNTAKTVGAGAKFVLDKGTAVGGAAAAGFGAAGNVFRIVTSSVGTFFNLINVIFDLRAAISAGKQVYSLKQIAKKAKDEGHDPAVVAAVEFAMQQKYEKAIKRSIAFVGAALGSGVTIAVLAGAGAVALLSNPVGWGILTILTAGVVAIGVGMFLFKLFRKIWKAYHGTLGTKRRDIAIVLYNKGIVEKDPVALKALGELGLDILAMQKAAEIGDQAIDLDIPGLEGQKQEYEAKIAEAKAEIRKEERIENLTSDRGLKERHKATIRQWQKDIKKWQGKIDTLDKTIMAKAGAALKKTGVLEAHKQQVLAALRVNMQRQERKLADVRAELAREEHAKKFSYSDSMKARHQERINYLTDRVKHYTGKIAALNKQIAWKGLTKTARNDIKQIERKLKSN